MARAKSAAPAKIAYFTSGTAVVVALEVLGFHDMVVDQDCCCVVWEAMMNGCNCGNCTLLRSESV